MAKTAISHEKAVDTAVSRVINGYTSAIKHLIATAVLPQMREGGFINNSPNPDIPAVFVCDDPTNTLKYAFRPVYSVYLTPEGKLVSMNAIMKDDLAFIELDGGMPKSSQASLKLLQSILKGLVNWLEHQ